MKKILMTLAMAVLSLAASAQEKPVGRLYSLCGNTIKVSISKTAADSVNTGFKFEDRKGKSYVVWERPKTGAMYYWRTSKAGKPYRVYLDAEAKSAINRARKNNIATWARR